MALLAHVLGIFTWWIGPLVLFLARRDSKFVGFHAMQALLLQALFMIVAMIGMAVWFALIFTMIFSHPSSLPNTPNQAPPLAFFGFISAIWLTFGVAYITHAVLGIIFAVKAGRGEWARYALIGRLALRIVDVHEAG
jgi:uncharacterized membrane protein